MSSYRRITKYLSTRDLKVGILFNIILNPSSKEKTDHAHEDWIMDHVKAVQKAIMKLQLSCHLLPVKEDVRFLIDSIKLFRPDVVVNLCEAFFGRSQLEMSVAGVLELLKIPYTGSPPLTLGM